MCWCTRLSRKSLAEHVDWRYSGWVAYFLWLCCCDWQFGIEAWLLFAIMCCWQHPHFYAIAWMYRDEYEQAGFKMLSVVDKNGDRLFIQVILYSLLLLAISVVPVAFGMVGRLYLVGAVVLGVYFTLVGIKFVVHHTQRDARNLLKASIIYLPALFAVGFIDVLV